MKTEAEMRVMLALEEFLEPLEARRQARNAISPNTPEGTSPPLAPCVSDFGLLGTVRG